MSPDLFKLQRPQTVKKLGSDQTFCCHKKNWKLLLK
jgi:hypothetical protein